MQHAELVSAIRSGEFRPVYLLCGSQSFLVDAVLDALKEAVGASKHGAFACETVHGPETTGEKVRAAAREVPMMVPRRLLIVREADAIAKREADAAALLAYVENPSPTTILALVAEAFDLRTKLARRIGEVGAVLRPEKVGKDAVRFARDHAGTLGADLSADAAAALVDLCGDDLAAIHDALSRLALNADGNRAIGPADVHEHVAPSRQHSVFELVDAFAGRDAGAAVTLAERLIEQGEVPLRILSLLARQIRLLVCAKEDPGHPRLAALPQFVRSRIAGQASRFTMRGLVHAVTAIHRTDVALKSSRREPERILEWLVLEIADPGTAGARTARGSRRHT